MPPPTLPPIEPIGAHQGGWDELIVVAAPIVLFILIRWAARRREKRPDDGEEG